MNARRFAGALAVGIVVWSTEAPTALAQCCLNDLFAGCASCFRRAPVAYAVAPVAPVAAPAMMAPQPYAVAPVPVPAPTPPMMVPVQQVSYVPETTYRTQYQCVPVTTYKPSTEVDPCTGCPRECMQEVTQYVQQAVNVPVTQYRAVYSTKYVQVQPGTGQPIGTQPMVSQPVPGTVPSSTVVPGPAGAAVSPFAAPLQTSPQAWGSAGADIPNQLIPGQSSIAAPALTPSALSPGATVPAVPPPTFQPQIVPQSGTFAVPQGGALTPQPTAPAALNPTPALRPIPELSGTSPPVGTTRDAGKPLVPVTPSSPVPSTLPSTPAPTAPGVGGNGAGGGVGTGATMPILQGTGPAANTGAFPRLLEPTGHTTSLSPATPVGGLPDAAVSYPRTALPARLARGLPQP
ncbi:MAG: hypothetical protein ACKO9B_00335 [Planctomycetota bacterium]